MVVGVISGDVRVLGDGVERVDHVVPDSVGSNGLGGGCGTADCFGLRVVGLDHGKLVLGDAEGGPEELLLADDEAGDELGEQGWADFIAPDLALLVECLAFQEGLHCVLDAEDAGDPAEYADGVLRAAGVVEAETALAGEDVRVTEPVLESTAGQVR